MALARVAQRPSCTLPQDDEDVSINNEICSSHPKLGRESRCQERGHRTLVRHRKYFPYAA